MILVISSPSSSTSGRRTLILLTPGDAIWTPMPGVSSICFTSFVAPTSDPPREQGAPWQTHTVFNQAPPLEDLDVYSSNVPLVEAVEREGAAWIGERAGGRGRFGGGAQQQSGGRLANENKPVLRTHDRFGHRVDEVEFHPAWHELMTVAIGAGMHAAPWPDPRPGAHVARAAKLYVWGRTDAGHCCPVSMTYAIVPALRNAPDLARRFEPLLASAAYDFGLRAPGDERGPLARVSLTGEQGG